MMRIFSALKRLLLKREAYYTVNLTGEGPIGRDAVRSLMDQLNEEIDNGATIKGISIPRQEIEANKQYHIGGHTVTLARVPSLGDLIRVADFIEVDGKPVAQGDIVPNWLMAFLKGNLNA